VEGGVDSVVFKQFLHHMLLGIRNQPEFASRNVILLMDNARIHHHQMVLETARRMKVNVLFNAQYSPWLNPVESLFAHLKSRLSEAGIATR
jgi:transposase